MVAAIVAGLCIAAVIGFAVAQMVFGPKGAVVLTGVIGGCFGGPPGAGIGIIVGLILVPVVGFCGLLLHLSPDE